MQPAAGGGGDSDALPVLDAVREDEGDGAAVRVAVAVPLALAGVAVLVAELLGDTRVRVAVGAAPNGVSQGQKRWAMPGAEVLHCPTPPPHWH